MSPRDMDTNCDTVYSNINVKDYGLGKSDSNFIVIRIIVIAACILILFLFNVIFGHHRAKKNVTAYRLYKFSVVSSFLSLMIASLQSYLIFTTYKTTSSPSMAGALILAASLGSIVLGYFVVSEGLWQKTFEEYSIYFLLPNWLWQYLDDRLYSDNEKKSFVALVSYPVFSVGILPMGLLVSIFYGIPMLLLSIITMEVRKLYRWINAGFYDKSVKQRETSNHYGLFKDYYLILDLNEDARQDDIDRTFNKAMAKYNSKIASDTYDENYRLNIIEAYRVLSSTARLKPKYDNEYRKYKSSSSSSYTYSDKDLDRDISIIQKEIHKSPSSKTRRETKSRNPIIIVFCMYWLIVIFIIVYLLMPNLSDNRHRRNIDRQEIYW